MNIVVIVRPVPGWEKPRFNMQTGEPEVSAGTAVGLTAWGEGTWVLNLPDRNALDLALTRAEADREGESQVTALALATPDPTAAQEALYAALARGAHGAILLDNPDYGSDPAVAATAVAAAIRTLAADRPVDLVLTGAEAPDGGPDALAPMLAEALGWSQATGVRGLTAEGPLQAEQEWDGARRTVGIGLPAVVSVARQVNSPARYTKLGRELVAYRQGRIDTWDAARLGLDKADAGALTPRVTIRRNALADAPTGERLTGPVEESVAVVIQGLKAQGRL